MKNFSTKTRKEIISYFLVILGSALFAIGDVMFVNPYHLAPGGTYGLSNVLNTVWPWRISYYAICMDIPLLLIGTWILGPRFGFKTILSTILIFLFTWVLESVWGYAPVVFAGEIVSTEPAELNHWMEIPQGGGWFMPDFVVNTLLAGIIYGLAIGLIFRGGATSGGSDIISMIIHKYTKVSLGTLVMIVDGCITCNGAPGRGPQLHYKRTSPRRYRHPGPGTLQGPGTAYDILQSQPRRFRQAQEQSPPARPRRLRERDKQQRSDGPGIPRPPESIGGCRAGPKSRDVFRIHDNYSGIIDNEPSGESADLCIS